MIDVEEDFKTKEEYVELAKYDQSNISFYEEDVQTYLKSVELKDRKVLQQV